MQGFGNFHGVCHGGFAIQDHQSVHPIVCEGKLARFVVPIIAGHACQVNRVFRRPKVGHMLFKLFLNRFRGKLERHTGIFCGICSQHADTAAVGDDQQVIPAHAGLQ